MKEWEAKINNALKGKTIKKCRYLNDAEMEDIGCYSKACVIEFTDGSFIFPSAKEIKKMNLYNLPEYVVESLYYEGDALGDNMVIFVSSDGERCSKVFSNKEGVIHCIKEHYESKEGWEIEFVFINGRKKEFTLEVEVEVRNC